MPHESFKFDPLVEYVCKFTFAKSAQTSNTTSKGLHQPDGSIRFAASEKIAVNDTVVDTDMTVIVLEGNGKQLGTGLVPPEELTALYEDPSLKRKPFQLVIMG